jgi:hypothetical protein
MGVAQMVECLPSKFKALSSTSVSQKISGYIENVRLEV